MALPTNIFSLAKHIHKKQYFLFPLQTLLHLTAVGVLEKTILAFKVEGMLLIS